MKNEIILFGFSGSGKSTIANLISEKYRLRVVHPSGILRNLYAGKRVDIDHTQYNTGFWESEDGMTLFKKRLNEIEPLDVVSDRILVHEIKKGNVVIDSWSLPWLTDIGEKIYLKADLDVRAKRVSIRNNMPYETAKEIISIKDEETTKLFKRLYGFDIKNDHEIFHKIIDTNSLGKYQVFENVCNYLDLV
jgi:CMP/dCMP kinase